MENVNLTIPRGAVVGILGGTGSGKSTLVNLIARLYDVTDGAVKIFGNDVRDYENAQLRSTFGVVPQKAVLFQGSVRDNVKWGNENASDEEIIKALKISQSYDFVFAKKNGLDEEISQGGKNLSGGQRQRLTIARALVSEPDILILDDSSSALDFATDAKLRKSLDELRKSEGLTLIAVSQRASSVMYSDIIVVMDDGKIEAVGSHDELMKSSQIYREIYSSQNKEDI